MEPYCEMKQRMNMKTKSTQHGREILNESFFIKRSIISEAVKYSEDLSFLNAQSRPDMKTTATNKPIANSYQLTANRLPNHSTFFMKKILRRSGIFAIALLIANLFFVQNSYGQTTVFQFGFENTTNVTTNNAVGTPSFTSSGLTGTVFSNSSPCVGTYMYTGASWSTGDYYQFTVNTTGYSNLTFSYCDRASSTSIAQFLVRVSPDGTNWTTVLNAYTGSTSNTTRTTSAFPASCESVPTVYIQIYKSNSSGSSGYTENIDNATLTAGGTVTASTFNSSGTYSFIPPAGVTCIQVEAWGGGGKGGQRTSAGAGAGGGGGAYAKKFISVTPGNSYTVTVGGGSTTTAAGGDSWFSTSGTILAKGGNSAAVNSNTSVSGQSGSIGDLVYMGGNSAIGTTGSFGGGGGSSGGTGANGNYTNTTTNSSTGGAITGGGSGGSGRTGGSSGVGLPGDAPGGGGGGALMIGTANQGGSGADGQVLITWVDASNFSVSSNSPICIGAGATINLTSTTLADGSYDVTYTTTNPAGGTTVTVPFSSGSGSFTISGLTGSPSVVAITSIAFTGGGCSTSLTGKTTNVTVNPTLNSGTVGSDQTYNCSFSQNPTAFTQITAASGGTGTFTYQWQSSTDNITFNNISAATSSTYDASTITQTTYYRRQVTSGGCVGYTNVITVTLGSPSYSNNSSAGLTVTPCINMPSNVQLVSTTIDAVQYFVMNVIKGLTYQVYTTESPSTALQLTVYEEGNSSGPILAHSSSNTGNPGTSNSNDVYLSFTSPLSGQVRILINGRTNCAATISNINTDVNVSGGSNTQDNETAAGTNSWIGHIYDGMNNAVPYTGNFANYLGDTTETEIFNETFGDAGDANCGNKVGSNGATRATVEDVSFSVRYRMNSTSRKGLYVVDIGSDDGSRLAVDGTLVYDNFVDQGYAAKPRILMNLTGNSNLVLDYYENAGGNQISFQNLTLVLANNLTTNISQTVCLGQTGAAISGDAFGSLPSGIALSGTGYQWSYSTTPGGLRTDIAGATSATFTPSTSVAPFNVSGTYYIYRNAKLVSASNNTGVPNYVATNESNAATLIVGGAPPSTPSITPGGPTTFCTGGSVDLSSSSASGNQWYKDGVAIGGATSNIYTATVSGSYTVIVTSGGCPSAASTPVVVTVNTNTAGPPSSSAPVCINATLAPITIATTGATGISNDGIPGANNLPAGVSATWAANVITISGTPTSAANTYTYSILLTGGCGTVYATGSITVKALPNATFTYGNNPAYYCLNGTGNPTPSGIVTAGGTFSYAQVSGPAGTISLNPATGVITLSSSNAGVYQVTYTVTVNGCTNTHSENIELRTPTTATLSYPNSGNFCVTDGNSYDPTHDPAYPTINGSYSASPAGLSIDDVDPEGSGGNPGRINPSASAPGVYTVTYNFSDPIGGCTNTATTTVTIYANPAINPMSTMACSGATFTVTPVNVTNGVVPSGTTYSWSAPGLPTGLTGGSSGSGSSISDAVTNTTSGPLDALYTVTPTNGACSGNTFTVTVTVNPKPAINNLTASSTCSSVGFTVTPVDVTDGVVPSGTTYSWSAPVVTGGMSGGTSGSGLSISGTLMNTSGSDQTATYTVTPTSGSCTGNSFMVMVTVKSAPAVTLSASYICLGSSSVLLTPTSGGHWVSSDPSIASVTDDGTVTASSVNSGSVTFTFTNTATGCSSTTSSLTVDNTCQVITLTQPTQVTASISANGPLTICAGQTSSIIVTVSGGSGSYKVVVGADQQTGAGPFTFTVAPTSTTTYDQSTVTVTDVPNGCTSITSGPVMINVNPATAISNGPTSYGLCIGDAVTDLSVSASGTGTLHYQWYSNTTPDNSGGNPVGLDQSTYTPAISTATAGMYYYYVIVTSDCGTATSAVATITVHDLPTASLSYTGAATICSGTSANISISFTGAAPFSFTYNDGTDHTLTGISDNPYTLVVNPSFPGTTYSLVSVSDHNGCNNSASGSTLINVYGTTITSTCSSCASSPTICAGGNPGAITISNISGGDGNYTYQWQQSENCTGTWVNVVGGSGANTVSFDPDPLSVTTCYRLQITDGCGTVAYSDTKTINVVPDPVSPTINPSPADGTTVCVGADVSATFNPGSGGTGTITDTYLYSTDGGNTWNTYVPGTTIITATTDMVGSNMIQISAQRTATGTGCNNGAVNVVKWSVAAQPVSGTLTKTPDVTTVCEGDLVSATATAGTGGSGNINDVVEYRFDGTGDWTTYSPVGSDLSTSNHTLVEIRTYRTADGASCNQSDPTVVSWVVRPTPMASISGNATVCQNDVVYITFTNPTASKETITYNINGGW